ncbi:hypothetical protein ODV97_19665 [Enterococcus gallinarum]|nr:hypothetical protein [Enterococcus gallinarum]
MLPSGAIQEEPFKRIFFKRETEKDAGQQNCLSGCIFSGFRVEEGLKKVLE